MFRAVETSVDAAGCAAEIAARVGLSTPLAALAASRSTLSWEAVLSAARNAGAGHLRPQAPPDPRVCLPRDDRGRRQETGATTYLHAKIARHVLGASRRGRSNWMPTPRSSSRLSLALKARTRSATPIPCITSFPITA